MTTLTLISLTVSIMSVLIFVVFTIRLFILNRQLDARILEKIRNSNPPDTRKLGIRYFDIMLDIESYGVRYTRNYADDLVGEDMSISDFALAEALEQEGLFEGKIKTPYMITDCQGYEYTIHRIYKK
jgi:hypothetical protein